MNRLYPKQTVIIKNDDGSSDFVVGNFSYTLSAEQTDFIEKFRYVAQARTEDCLFKFEVDKNDFDEFQKTIADMGWGQEFKTREEKEKIKFSANEVGQIISSAMEMWKPLPGFNKMFRELDNIKCLPFFYVIEQTWFIWKASEYLYPAANYAKNKKLKKLLFEIADCEENHYKPLLNSIGLSIDDIKRYDASAGLRGLVAQLYQIGTTDTQSFIIYSSILETSKDELPNVKKHVDRLSKLVGINLSEYYNHHKIDAEEQHVDEWKEVLAIADTYSFERVSKFIEDLHSIKHAIDGWFDSLLLLAMQYENELPAFVDGEPLMFIRPKPDAESIAYE